jgi:hypothetical protein
LKTGGIFMNSQPKWNLEADYLQACSCDYGCPCEFSAPPTTGFCEGVGAWRIERGEYGGTRLDGLGLGFAARWPKAIHEGNGTACLFIDERATPEQRAALLEIGSGKAGGLPFELLATTFSKLLPPQFLPMEFHLDGRQSSVQVGDAMRAVFEPIRNPVTRQPESVRIEHSTGFIFKQAECVSAAAMQANAGELNFSWPNKAGFVTRVQYGK